jgi:TolA-binding protein
MKKMANLLWSLLILITGVFSVQAEPVEAVYPAEAFTRYLETIYKMEDKKLDDFVIHELQQFATVFPSDENAPNALFLMAESYRRQKKTHDAFANYLKTIFVYPENRHKDACLNAIRDIAATDRNYTDARDTLTSILTWKFEKRPTADGYHQFIKALLDLNVDKLNKVAFAEAVWFFEKFPDYSGCDEVAKWIADLQVELGDAHEAAASYLKLEYLFPQSPYLLHSRYNRGLLLYNKLKSPQEARRVFEQIIADYPESQFAGFSQYYVGEIYEKKEQNYDGAIESYLNLVAMDSLHQMAVPALKAVSKIQLDKQKDYPAAIQSLQILSRLPQVSPEVALDALMESAKIYESRLRDYQAAIDMDVRIVTLFPDNEEAPNILYSAAELAEKKLNDAEQALKLLTEISEKYPNTKKKNTVNSKIKKLQEKLTPEDLPE